MDIAELVPLARAFAGRLDEAKANLSDRAIPWYPYGSIDNIWLLSQMLGEGRRDLVALAGGRPVLDIGAADGEVAFFLESLGFDVDVIDHPPTNYNGCRALSALREALGSRIGIHLQDIDRQFVLPDREYGLAVFLGILYHLKNPFYVLEQLSERVRYMLLSTRVAKFDRASGRDGARWRFESVPAAYLLAPDECNNDATNFWIFSNAGLKRLVDRAGWDVVDYRTFGNTIDSDPATQAGDERAFCLLRSRHFGG
jgi:2-polyprenyl-3-methyl-5-hydroxy-6-metoxy-1,4-benzoquinol methylase